MLRHAPSTPGDDCVRLLGQFCGKQAVPCARAQDSPRLIQTIPYHSSPEDHVLIILRTSSVQLLLGGNSGPNSVPLRFFAIDQRNRASWF